MLEEIRKNDKEIPFIIYAVKRKEHVDEAIKRGAQGCTNESEELIDLVIKNLLKN